MISHQRTRRDADLTSNTEGQKPFTQPGTAEERRPIRLELLPTRVLFGGLTDTDNANNRLGTITE